MRFPHTAATRTSAEAAANTTYDAVIVGAGVSGAIIANELAQAGKRVLLVEAGPGEDFTIGGYQTYLEQFYASASKDNQAPFPRNPNAPSPRSSDVRRPYQGQVEDEGYLVQPGPFYTDTTYTRVLGGTTIHWEGKTPRFLPDDFNTASKYSQGQDWPISYDELEPYYRAAEREMGVSAEVESQKYLGASYPDDYVYPMHGMPHSYLDTRVNAGLEGTDIELMGERYALQVRPYPQARNGVPNPAYDGGAGYEPVGAVSTHEVDFGGRCQGNTNCVPICPVQAKYHAGKTLAKALQTGNLELLTQAVASKVVVDSENGRVSELEVKCYADTASPEHRVVKLKATTFILSAGAIETARLMLASGLPSSSGLMGRNLMDHAYLLSWGLMPEICGTMRGTVATGGIVALRSGNFRSRQAAFAVDIHNDGWGWATGAPFTDLENLVDNSNKFGRELRENLVSQISRQLLFAFMVEVMPSPSNRVTVDPNYKDALGNMRPVVSYEVPEYSMRGVQYARRFARTMFGRLGVEDHTHYDPADPGYVFYDGEGYAIRGGNHLAGTHIMGSSKRNSVVDADQRSWDHQNLFLVGGGSMPTIGTANITLTLAAMCLRTAKTIITDLS